MTMVSSESNPPVGNLNGGEIYLPESSVDGSNPGLELLPVPLPKVGGDDDFSHRRNSRVNEGSSPEKQSGSGSVFSAFFFSLLFTCGSVFWQLSMGLTKILAKGRIKAPGI